MSRSPVTIDPADAIVGYVDAAIETAAEAIRGYGCPTARRAREAALERLRAALQRRKVLMSEPTEAQLEAVCSEMEREDSRAHATITGTRAAWAMIAPIVRAEALEEAAEYVDYLGGDTGKAAALEIRRWVAYGCRSPLTEP